MTDSGSFPQLVATKELVTTQGGTKPAPSSTTATGASIPGPAKAAPPDIFFTRHEFDIILSLYGRKVVEGEWRDYSIAATKEAAIFAIHRRSGETPLYRIEKRPKLARRQGAFSVIAASGLILKRGQDLAQVLRVLDKRKLRLID